MIRTSAGIFTAHALPVLYWFAFGLVAGRIRCRSVPQILGLGLGVGVFAFVCSAAADGLVALLRG